MALQKLSHYSGLTVLAFVSADLYRHLFTGCCDSPLRDEPTRTGTLQIGRESGLRKGNAERCRFGPVDVQAAQR